MLWKTTLFLLSLVCVIGAEKMFQSSSNLNVMTPNYPKYYPPNANHEWIFNQTSGRFAATFVQFELEDSRVCSKDYLKIYKHMKGKPDLLCSTQVFQTILSEGPYLRLVFESDDTIEKRGFHIQVRHFYDQGDVERKILSYRQSANVNLVKKEESVTPLMIGIVSVLSLALMVFFIMLGILIVGIVKKRREKEAYSKFLHTNIIAQMANTAGTGTGRKYSRSVSFSNDFTKTALAPRASNQSTRFVPIDASRYPVSTGVIV